jgi:hypothetical protein
MRVDRPVPGAPAPPSAVAPTANEEAHATVTWAPWVSRAARIAAAALAASVAGLLLHHLVTHDGFDATAGGDLVPLLLAATGLLMTAAVVLFRPEQGTIRALRLTAIAWTLTLVAALAAIWFLIDNDVSLDPAIGTRVVSATESDAFLASVLAPPPAGQAASAAEPWRIPTGVLVQTIEFLNPNDVQVSGYVWQTFPPGFPADIARGLSFPEAVSDTSPANPIYTVDQADGGQVVGWRFRVNLRQQFDYGRYPFDRQDVWLRLWSNDVQRRVLLVPDFASYGTLNPMTLAGLGQGFVNAGWQPVRTEFSYAVVQEETTFGLEPRPGTLLAPAPFPELFYNVSLKRSFLEPFLDDVLFACVVAVLLFFVLSLTARDAAKKSRVGISTFGVLGTCSGLFFAVILKDTQIRQSVSTGEIVYAEALSFLLYGAILLVAVNALLLDSPLRLAFIDYRDNLLPDLLYWPVLLGALLALTILAFFT